MGLFGPKTNTSINALGKQEEEDIDVRLGHQSIKRREKNSQRIRNGFVPCPNYMYPGAGKNLKLALIDHSDGCMWSLQFIAKLEITVFSGL